jgi:predicted metal-dependent phosphoesterase TrpH|tara:strand:- start:1432 stop:2673 length:1242 start_codon:yes stop_codon:yes gene_type:complete
MRTSIVLLFNLFFLPSLALSHEVAGSFSKYRIPGRLIEFPDTENYKTIVADLHTHSVFSDGHVWPNIRVAEALRDGLDAIAITEHLEYQPHISEIPHSDRNVAFIEASRAAKGTDIIVIAGSEITRENPIGHINAIFIENANKLINLDKSNLPAAKKLIEARQNEADKENMDMVNHLALSYVWPVEEAISEANRQGAFVFLNHPMWNARDGIAKLSSLHEEFIAQNLLHGIEVVNENTFSEEALAIALEKKLTIIGTSDVHNLIDWDYIPHQGNHRPVTLIFSKERDKNSIKEALFDGRTVVWFENLLIGEERNIIPLLESLLTIDSAVYKDNPSILNLTISNQSDARMQINNLSEYTFMSNHDFIEIPQNSSVELSVKTKNNLQEIEMDFEVFNALISPKTHPILTLKSIIQ